MATPLRSPILTTPRVRHRKSANKLRPDQLKAVRDGFEAIKKLHDTNGFWFWAELHGTPKNKCEHSPRTGYDNLFLPWHRAYLYRLELALQTKVPAATLPWWDWPASRTGGGIPAVFEDIAGALNPLSGADFPPRVAELVAAEGLPGSTWREPAEPSRLPAKEKDPQQSLHVDQVPVPEVGPDEILVKVAKTGSTEPSVSFPTPTTVTATQRTTIRSGLCSRMVGPTMVTPRLM